MESYASFEGKMAGFREEIAELMTKKPGHFRYGEFELKDLTGSDGAIWDAIKNETITKEELAEYAEEVKSSGNASRETFLGLINNEAMGVFIKREVALRGNKHGI